jgi:diguanylate cyclase (GGDEF)-like protein
VFVSVGALRDINDSFGPETGDRLIRAVADRLSTVDVPGTQVLRYSGAELAMVFERLQQAELVEEVCSFLIELLSPAFEIGDVRLDVNPNVGAAVSSDKYDNFDDLIKDAHDALVRAREQGHGAYHVHDEIRRARHTTRIDEARMANALENREFFLHYQPIVRTDNREMIGAEALIRWQAPGATNTGVLYPHDFMPLLEKSGLGVRVGEWVIEEACRQVVEWAKLFPQNRALFITCNVGPKQLAQIDFRESVTRAVEATGIEPWQLCLDITEEALRYNRNATWTALRELKDLGIKLGLDDFGTGVSSLTYLRELKLDLVRVDRAFVSNLENSREDRAIVKHIAGLAHDLDLIAIAEGVETEEQADMLYKLGVDLAQGFFFGRPMQAREVTEELRPADAPKPDDRWAADKVYEHGS